MPGIVDRITGDGPWLYVLAAVAVILLALVAVLLLRALREGRSVEVTRDGIKVGERARPAVDPAPPGPGSPAGPAPGPERGQLEGWERFAVGVDHDRLFGVDQVIESLVGSVRSGTTGWAITVSGEGGNGKTAVTYDAVGRLAATDDFTTIVWASARNAQFAAEDVAKAVSPLRWQELVEIIARQLGCPLGSDRSSWDRDLQHHVRELDPAQRILLVIDNLEGVDDAARTIDRVERLGLGRPHKLIATTRWKVGRDDHLSVDFPVPPLDRRHSLELARSLATNDPEFDSRSDRQLAPIFDLTEGNPFLIKLVIRRYLLSGLPLDRILADLVTVGRSGGSLGGRVRQYLFAQSLDELAGRFGRDSVERLMASFCFSTRGDVLTFDELGTWSGLGATDDFPRLVEAACRLALVRPSQGNRRYSIHSLLYEFTCGGGAAHPDGP